MTTRRKPTANRRLAQWRVTWLIEHSTSHQLFWCIDSFVLRNPPLRQAENVSGNAKPKQGTMKPELKRIRKVEYDIDPNRYELRSGSETNAPLCPYGNHYKWIGFDLKTNEYVRLTKSVFKLLINKIENE